MLAVAFIKNCLVHNMIGITPYEALQGTQPDLSCLWALGCCCWYNVPKEIHSSKLTPHAAEACFISYSEGLYKVYDMQTRKIHHSWDVKFDERPLMEHRSSSYNFDESPQLLDSPHNIPFWQPDIPLELINLHDADTTKSRHPPSPPPLEEPFKNTKSVGKPSWMWEYECTGVLLPINQVDSHIINIDTAQHQETEPGSGSTSTPSDPPNTLDTPETTIPLPISRPITPEDSTVSVQDQAQPQAPKTVKIWQSSRLQKPSWALLKLMQAHTVLL